ncbi:hypothetical protein [Flavilitoribacter nigricans]|uniref:Uncharacterized protein n=1 Tax=Flavilitoribacter nigricans (strain ATCC 23147 / DSM 23189 / NBRC 102662 / NCIMB 1420 / SS-2) TaxID=1122177 RepID=A0A2D0NAM2_FLAN2|nr:hypothetical protein [Flavilitoribacter nigricans]PHN05410.1 hypothetical protein CRP01_15545 [Flavilitoribacter nigricans DSM 23189 = NBRC 102662]
MTTIHLNIPGIDAHALSIHLLVVIKNYIEGKEAGSIPAQKMEYLEAMDRSYLKLDQLSQCHDDETPQPLALTTEEAEAVIRAFTDAEFQELALRDEYYQKNSYTSYFGLIYAKYLKKISEAYVDALASA